MQETASDIKLLEIKAQGQNNKRWARESKKKWMHGFMNYVKGIEFYPNNTEGTNGSTGSGVMWCDQDPRWETS